MVSLPQGVFTGVGTGVKTNLIFFERGKPTKDVWYYEVQGKFTKGKPITDAALEDCLKKYQKRAEPARRSHGAGGSDQSWITLAEKLKNYDLTAKNPNSKSDIIHRSPSELIKDIGIKEAKITQILEEIKKTL